MFRSFQRHDLTRNKNQEIKSKKNRIEEPDKELDTR